MNAVFRFDSLADFWAMSGHGPFVWAAYGITFASLTFLVWQGRLRRKQVVKKVKLAQQRAEQHSN